MEDEFLFGKKFCVVDDVVDVVRNVKSCVKGEGC